ncbi:MAG: glycosyltransferase family 4 protein [Acidimicrobiales bacterium]
MKVLFVNENIGGHATVHHHLRRALEHHPEVEATFLDAPPAGLLRRIVGASLPLLGRLDLDLQPLRAQLALSFAVRRRLRRLIDNADVVHLYTQNAGLASIGLLRRRPLVVSLDTTNARNAYRLPYRAPTRFTPWTVPLSKWFEQRVFAQAHTVVANSEWAASSLRADYGLAGDQLVVSPSGIAAPVGERSADRSDRPVIVFLGRQLERKGGLELIEAWRNHVADRADLLLVTKDPVPPAPGLSVVDDLDQGDARLWQILADADILAFPSTIDQAPNAVIEAMAAGLPVVATPVAGITEMVIDGETGRHVPPHDPDAMGKALAELVNDPAMRARMGAAGRARYEAVYDIDRTVCRLIDVLTAAASPRELGGRS